MTRIRLLGMMSAVLLATTLVACTSFAPVYGDRSAAAIASTRFSFAPPANRLSQIVLNRLAIAFPATGGAGDPVLSVAAVKSGPSIGISNAIPAGRPVGVRVEATVTIRQPDGQTVSFTRFADTSYQGEKLSPTNYESEIGAEEAAANAVAEALRAAILASYRPGGVSTPQR